VANQLWISLYTSFLSTSLAAATTIAGFFGQF
jgi:hypothetical protein